MSTLKWEAVGLRAFTRHDSDIFHPWRSKARSATALLLLHVTVYILEPLPMVNEARCDSLYSNPRGPPESWQCTS